MVVTVGAPCNDGNACTQNDVCQPNGMCAGTAITCPPVDQCRAAGICDPATGQCSNPPAEFGTPCDDGNACTTGDHCELDVCRGTSIICQPVADPAGCWNQPTCDPATGTCTQATPKASGTPCDDGNLCTTSTCDGAGACIGVPKNCGGLTVGSCPQKCDPATGACVAGENGDACIPSSFGQCQAGVCQDGGCVTVPAQVGDPCLVIMSPANPCMTGICGSDGQCQAVSVADGTACMPAESLGECQSGGICQSGACVVLDALDGTACGDVAAPECSRQSCQAGVCTNISRIGQRCEVELHGCLHYTCQANGCLDSGKTDDCNSTISCGGFGTCTEELPGIGVCHPIVCDDCCGGECGKRECTLLDGGKVCLPVNRVCEGVCYSEPVQCCGVSFPGTLIEAISTCDPTEICCLSGAGGYICCPATQTCGQFGCVA